MGIRDPCGNLQSQESTERFPAVTRMHDEEVVRRHHGLHVADVIFEHLDCRLAIVKPLQYSFIDNGPSYSP